MLEAIVNQITNDVPFAELTTNTIIICDALGFDVAKDIFVSFEKSKDGHPDYDYIFGESDDFENIKIQVFHVTEKEILVRVGEFQTIAIIHLNDLEGFEKLKLLNFALRDRWICGDGKITPLTEYRGHEKWADWNKYLMAVVQGRFNFSLEF